MIEHISDIKKAIVSPLYIGIGTKTKDAIIYLAIFPNKDTPYMIVAVRKIKKINKIILTAFRA